jgi:HSP20 family protein
VGVRPPVEDATIYAPAVDVVETNMGWRLVFEIPGAQANRLAVEVRGRLVTLRGERRPTEGESGRFLRVERAAGPFERSVELPDEPDEEGARASYEDGLLTIEVPRKTGPKARSIPIRRGPAELA